MTSSSRKWSCQTATWSRKDTSAHLLPDVLFPDEPRYKELPWMLYRQPSSGGNGWQFQKAESKGYEDCIFRIYHYWNAFSQQSFRGIHFCLPKYTKDWWEALRFSEALGIHPVIHLTYIVRGLSQSPFQRLLSSLSVWNRTSVHQWTKRGSIRRWIRYYRRRKLTFLSTHFIFILMWLRFQDCWINRTLFWFALLNIKMECCWK